MDAYKILGITPNASQDEIKKAWRAKARTCHPDCTKSNEDMGQINAAYDAIKDPARRADYDAQNGLHRPPDADAMMRGFEDLFADIFGRRSSAPSATRLSATIPFGAPLAPFTMQVSDPTGRRWRVEVPAGITDGQLLRLRPKTTGQDGDVVICIRCASHPSLQRDGTTVLHPRITVPMATAALGGSIEVSGIDGETFTLEIPEGTQTGDTLTIPHAGFPPFRGGERGDMRVPVFVATPTHLTPADRRALRRMAARANSSS